MTEKRQKFPYEIFKEKLTIRNLKKIYEQQFSKTRIKGIDRLNSEHLTKLKLRSALKTIAEKSSRGTYRFSPYLENLKGKGRGKYPRILAIPTIRDRIAIYALKEFLFDLFPECIHRRFANQYIREINKVIQEYDIAEISFFKTDIENFYGSIDHEKLIACLREKTRSSKAIEMIKKAITRPIVPRVYRKEDRANFRVSGIPQGLSISNILADIYMKKLDLLMQNQGKDVIYFRYVDDILIIGSKSKIKEASELFVKEITSPEKLSLTLNKVKTYSNLELIEGIEHRPSNEFEYLGYSLEFPKIYPNKKSEEKFIRSLMALFCEYKKAVIAAKNKRKKAPKMELIKKAFISRLNIKITGAIDEKRKYGWIFYFIEMNDLSCLHRIDKVIGQQFLKLEGFGCLPPRELKKMVRAYYSALYSPADGYIHNYNNFKTNEDKERFLVENGYIDVGKKLSSRKINTLFKKIKDENLASLVQDEIFGY